jgi:hypothetical protein
VAVERLANKVRLASSLVEGETIKIKLDSSCLDPSIMLYYGLSLLKTPMKSAQAANMNYGLALFWHNMLEVKEHTSSLIWTAP